MKILLAKDAGYCFGVRDAVKMAYDTSEKYENVFMLGDIVHNEHVVNDLTEAGSKVISSLDDIPQGKPVLFRAHGTNPEVWKEAKLKDINIVDATCPLVTEIHEEVRKLEEEKRKVIIIGDHGHDEVMGIAAQVKNPIIVSNVDEAIDLRRVKRAGVVTQSTQMIENVKEIINILTEKVYDLRFVNTICFPTKRNHEQIKKLASTSDVMIIIGSFTSANSKRLHQLALARNQKSYQVTGVRDIDKNWFNYSDVVGVSAGASTPDNIIDEVVDYLNNIK